MRNSPLSDKSCMLWRSLGMCVSWSLPLESLALCKHLVKELHSDCTLSFCRIRGRINKVQSVCVCLYNYIHYIYVCIDFLHLSNEKCDRWKRHESEVAGTLKSWLCVLETQKQRTCFHDYWSLLEKLPKYNAQMTNLKWNSGMGIAFWSINTEIQFLM